MFPIIHEFCITRMSHLPGFQASRLFTVDRISLLIGKTINYAELTYFYFMQMYYFIITPQNSVRILTISH